MYPKIFKSLFLIASLFIFYIPLSAQWPNQGQRKQNTVSVPDTLDVPKKGFDKKKLYGGGGFGFQFGNVTAIEISPLVGYQFHKMFRAGLGLNYSYYRFKNSISSQVYQSHIFGGSVFARFYPLRFLFLHAELVGLNHEIIESTGESHRKWTPYPLVGLGFSQSIGGISTLSLAVLWNLNDGQHSIYSNPIIQLGFGIGF